MSFRTKLLIAMTLVVFAVTGAGLFFAQRQVAVETEHGLERDFQAELASLHRAQEVRHAALAERCRALVRRPRIHAALEDNALDLLYPSAKDELRDLMHREDEASENEPEAHVLQGRFYRFLDASGTVISPLNSADVGELSVAEEAQLNLPGVSEKQQVGYLLRTAEDGSETLNQMIAMPIISGETGEVLAALVLGFKPDESRGKSAGQGMKSGLLLNGRLHLPALPETAQAALARELTRTLADSREPGSGFDVHIDATPYRLFHKRLNPGSYFPAAYEVCIYPLTSLLARQEELRWQAAVACGLLLLGGVAASHFLAGRLAMPVEKLAVDSAENRAQRQRAEAALEATSADLQRAARFSADASHQLKTPVTVLRAGLEELLAQENLAAELREEISALVHQTFRLATIIEDLLLLSRMDAGRFQIEFREVNLAQVIDALVDDLSTSLDPLQVEIDSDCPPLHISGERRYVTLILQNLLENARKYNRPGGRIRIGCREDGDWVNLTIGNTGRAIPPAAQAHIFERFHRGAIGENVPGYGLGLNLARELARIHGGDLRLIRSDEAWTEFTVRFRLAKHTQHAALGVA